MPHRLSTFVRHACACTALLAWVLANVPLADSAFAQDAPAAPSGTERTGETLKPLVPEQAAGWTRASARFSHEAPAAFEATYKKEGLPYRVFVSAGYGSNYRSGVETFVEREKAQAEEAVQEVERSGRTVHVLRARETVRLYVFSGDMAAFFAPCLETERACTVPNPDAARSELLALYDALDMERLAALGSPQSDASSSGAPAAGDAPDAAVDPQALAAFLPDTLAERARRDVKDRVSRGGAFVAGLYEDSLAVVLQDRGTISPRADSLLRHEAGEGRLRAFSIGDIPAFQHTGQKLQIDIRERDKLIPPLGAVALVGGRFLAQAALYSKSIRSDEDVAALPPERVKARIEAARTALEALDLKGLRTLAATYDTDFAERFAACQAPAATTVEQGTVAYQYELLGPRDGGCAVRAHFVKNPNPDWVGPSMTCVIDHTRPFGEAVKDTNRCEGPLAERMAGE